MHHPPLAEFRQLAKSADYVPVYRQLVSDTLTPVSAFHKLDEGSIACLFESVIGGEKVGRYSFLATDPYLLLEARDREVTVTEFGRPAGEHIAGKSQQSKRTVENPLQALRELVATVKVAKVPALPPFVGGAVGYAGYDTVRYVERLPNAPADDRQLPDLAFAFFDHMLVFDNVRKTFFIIVLAKTTGADADAAYREACSRVDAWLAGSPAPAKHSRRPILKRPANWL